MQSNVGIRLRVRYSKLGKVRFVSHRDGARLWERALRRVDLPVAYTEGFTPRPKVGFGLALPTAAESIAEYVDLDLSRDADLDPADPGWDDWLHDLTASISDALPSGMDAMAIAERSADVASLQEQVTSTTWELSGWEVAGQGLVPDSLDDALQRVLAADELLVERERKGQRRTDDVRPLIRDLTTRHDEGRTTVVADLVTIGRALRPAELAELMCTGVDGTSIRVRRTHQWIDHDGERREVIPLERHVTRTNEDERERTVVEHRHSDRTAVEDPGVEDPALEAGERRRVARAGSGGQAERRSG
ncbi:MAG: TIGR03936 family radical SAM-associated protein [Actinomycetota bacterium]